MAKRSGLEDIAWSFAFITGVITITDLLSQPKKQQEAKLKQDLTQAYLKSIHAKLTSKE